jgi:exopolysaccharide production protein ExoZ
VARPKLIVVQVLRALAALMVAMHHAQYDAAAVAARAGQPFTYSKLLPWTAGVDIFFVISGFIMVYASADLFGRREGPRLFLGRRVARIVPLYWAVMTLFLLIALIVPSAINSAAPSVWQVVASYLFIPTTGADGHVQPVYTLGWTLNYEMFFYCLFAVATMLPRRWAVLAVTVFFWCSINLPKQFGWPVPQILTVWFSPTVYEFAFGMWIALAFREGLRIPVWASGILIAAGAALIIRTDWDGFATIGRVSGWGGGAAMIVAGCVLANVRPTRSRPWLALVFLGDASYALYLLHGFALSKLFLAAPYLAPASHVWLYAAAGMIASTSVAIAAHLMLERPMTKSLQRRIAAMPTFCASAWRSLCRSTLFRDKVVRLRGPQ